MRVLRYLAFLIEQKRFGGLILILFLSFLPVLLNWHLFISDTPLADYQSRYSRSQYVMGDAAEEIVDDETAYVVAAESYASGEDPTKINFEHPPTIKYLYGLSYTLFGNMLWVNIAFSLLIYSIFWLFLIKYVKNDLLILAGLLSFGIFNLSIYLPTLYLLDWSYLAMTLLYFYLVWKEKTDLKGALLSGVVLGLWMSSKYYFPLLLLVLLVSFTRSFSNKKYSLFFAHILVALLIYLLSYYRYFLHDHSLLDFMRFELWRFDWWTGDRTMPKFQIVRLITTGSYYFDSETSRLAQSHYWNISWPLLFITWIASCLLSISKRSMAWIHFYSISLLFIYGFGGASAERYLIHFVPFWLLVIVYTLDTYLEKYLKMRK